jgi:hypothetical protein
MEQMNLWDFIPECENGKLAHGFLYFSEEAHESWMSPWYECPYSEDRQLKGEQINIFEVLGTSEEEIYRMSNMEELSREEIIGYLKYMTPAERTHWRYYLSYRTGSFMPPIQEINFASPSWIYNRFLDMQEINFVNNNRLEEEELSDKRKIRKGFRGYHGEESDLKKFLKKKGGK